MITDRIGRHKVLLPINHKNYNLRERKEEKQSHERKDKFASRECRSEIDYNLNVLDRFECDWLI